MEGSAQKQQQESLEEQLRRMMLSNVRLGNPPQQQQNHDGPQQRQYNSNYSSQGQRARGGGRGYHQGRGRGDASTGNWRGGYTDGHIPPHKRQGFDHFVAQHAAAGPAYLIQQPRVQHGSQHAQPNADPDSFRRGPPSSAHRGPDGRQQQQLWRNTAHPPRYQGRDPMQDLRVRYLEHLAAEEVPKIAMDEHELSQKDAFRSTLNAVIRNILSKNPVEGFDAISLESFGSIRSGFASKGSDMDLAIVTTSTSNADTSLVLGETSFPRLLEKELLEQGYGARLLTRTRVPIIKICEQPTIELLNALRDERTKWDAMSEDEKAGRPKNSPREANGHEQNAEEGDASLMAVPSIVPEATQTNGIELTSSEAADTRATAQLDLGEEMSSSIDEPQIGATRDVLQPAGIDLERPAPAKPAEQVQHKVRKQWIREKAQGRLDFPKEGVGIQCDINFFNPLGLHNTMLLRCYALCDPRVTPMVLFVKAWAKRRRINSSYSGTLSSYGFVLMVLHYLVNIARPPVLPNLQIWAERSSMEAQTIDGWEVRFWRNEEAIVQSAQGGSLTRNREPLGSLLKGFFQYFATSLSGHGYVWMQDVLSLRTPGGIVSKASKGWTAAKTETTETVRHHQPAL